MVGVSGEGRDKVVLTSDAGGVTAHTVSPCLFSADRDFFLVLSITGNSGGGSRGTGNQGRSCLQCSSQNKKGSGRAPSFCSLFGVSCLSCGQPV